MVGTTEASPGVAGDAAAWVTGASAPPSAADGGVRLAPDAANPETGASAAEAAAAPTGGDGDPLTAALAVDVTGAAATVARLGADVRPEAPELPVDGATGSVAAEPVAGTVDATAGRAAVVARTADVAVVGVEVGRPRPARAEGAGDGEAAAPPGVGVGRGAEAGAGEALAVAALAVEGTAAAVVGAAEVTGAAEVPDAAVAVDTTEVAVETAPVTGAAADVGAETIDDVAGAEVEPLALDIAACLAAGDAVVVDVAGALPDVAAVGVEVGVEADDTAVAALDAVVTAPVGLAASDEAVDFTAPTVPVSEAADAVPLHSSRSMTIPATTRTARRVHRRAAETLTRPTTTQAAWPTTKGHETPPRSMVIPGRGHRMLALTRVFNGGGGTRFERSTTACGRVASQPGRRLHTAPGSRRMAANTQRNTEGT